MVFDDPELKKTQRRLLLALGAAVFMANLDARVVAPLLPTLAAELGVSLSQSGWLVSAYLLPYGFCQLMFGPLADRYGKVAVCSHAPLARPGRRGAGPGLSRQRAGASLAGGLVRLLPARHRVQPVSHHAADPCHGGVPEWARYGGRLFAFSLFLGSGLGTVALGLLLDVVGFGALFACVGLLLIAFTLLVMRLPGQRAEPARKGADVRPVMN